MATNTMIRSFGEIKDKLIPELQTAYPSREEFNEAVGDIKKTARKDRAEVKDAMLKFRKEQRQRTSNIEDRLMAEAKSRVSVESHVNAVNGLKAGDLITAAMVHKGIEDATGDWYEYYVHELTKGREGRVTELRNAAVMRFSDGAAFVDCLLPGLAFVIPTALILGVLHVAGLVETGMLLLIILLSYLCGVMFLWSGRYRAYRRIATAFDEALKEITGITDDMDASAYRLYEEYDNFISNSIINDIIFKNHSGESDKLTYLIDMFRYCQTHTRCSIEQLQQHFLKENAAKSTEDAAE